MHDNGTGDLMFKSSILLFMMANTAIGQTGKPPLPTGLWQAKDKGFVVRIEACSGGFCGVTAGSPAGGKKNPEDNCGKPIFINFIWNQDSGRWNGQMHPPDRDMTLNSQIDTDGKTFLTVHAHAGIISKTISFAPYTGKIGEGCRLEP
jgi:uncharacterized protein (DUF2147 family)